MKKLIFLALMVSALLIACNNTPQETQIETQLTDSTLINEPLETQEVDQMVNLVNSVAGSLDSVLLQEQMILKMEEGTPKDQVLARLKAFQDLLARKQNQIRELAKQNKSNKVSLANLQKMMDFLNLQLSEKSDRIARWKEAVETKDMKISELRYDLDQVSRESEYLQDQNYEQDKQLNAAFYIIGDKKELKSLGLLDDGFLKKSKADYSSLDQSKFTKRDIRGLEKLSIDSKSPKILTPHPESSYEMTKNEDGTTTLKINNADAFWSVTHYLIILK